MPCRALLPQNPFEPRHHPEMIEQSLAGFPVSRQQQRLFDLEGLQGPGNHLTVLINAAIDQQSFSDCLMEFVRNAENFHVSLVKNPVSKYPLQQILDAPQTMIRFHRTEDESQARKSLQNLIRAPFHADSPECIRFHCFSWGGPKSLLLASSSRFFSDFQSFADLLRHLEGWITGAEITRAEEEPLQYLDYSEWQHELFLEQSADGYRFWSGIGKALAAAIPGQDPLAEAVADCTTQSFVLPRESVSSLTDIARSNDVSLNGLLTAAWWKVLNTFIARDVPLAYSHPGRNDEQTAGIFGLFEKYLVLPAETGNELHSLTQLAACADRTKKKQAFYQDYFHLENESGAGKPIYLPFQFACYEFPGGLPEIFELESLQVHADHFSIKLQIVLSGEKEAANCTIFNRSADIPGDWTAALADRFRQLLELEITLARQGAAQLQLQKNELAWAWQKAINPPAEGFDRSLESLVSGMENAARNHPHKAALVFEEKTISFESFHEQVNRIAHLIVSRTQHRTGKVIGVQFGNPVQMIIAFAAILKSGNAFLPIEPAQPEARAKFMIEQSQAVLFLSDQEWAVRDFPGITLKWVQLEEQSSGFPATAPAIALTAQSPCYLIFTSGTTGNPKGVLISHGSIANYLNWFITRHQINASDKTVLFSSMAFDLGHTIIWSALITGAELHLVAPENILAFIGGLNAYMAKQGISYIKCTPSHFKLILEDPDLPRWSGSQRLRLIFLGGEQIDAEDLNRYFKLHDGVLIVNEYGPTETTIGVIAKEITAETAAHFSRRPVIGRPYGGHSIFILDEDRNPVFPGEYGGIFIGGPGIALAYLHRPDLTAKAFVNLPSAWAGEGKYYDSGDLGRWLPDGDIQLAGRKDGQLKVRGYRIEPEEIAQVAAGMQGVRNAFVSAYRSEKTEIGIRMFACFTGPSATVDTLRTYLLDQLPEYMVPDQIFETDHIPLTPNGKVDRDALDRAAELELQKTSLKLPVTDTENRIAAIWRDLFGIPEIGVQQSFFQLGGHSLLAMKMLARVQKQLGLSMPLPEFFKQPTIAFLAAALHAGGKEQFTPIVPIQREPGALLTVSHAQRRIWMQAQLQEEEGGLNVYFAVRLKNDPDLANMADCLTALARRHEALRTNFKAVETGVMQVIREVERTFVPVEDLGTEAWSPARLHQEIIAASRRGFDLERDILFRCFRFREAAGDSILAFVFHHILVDEWSMDIFQQELTTLLTFGKEEGLRRLPELHVQYPDFAAWEKENCTEAYFKPMKAYFERQLSGQLPVLNLPTDFPRKTRKTFEGNSTGLDLDIDPEKLNNFCIERGCSMFSLLIASVKALLFRLTGQTDIIIGTLAANRIHPDLEHLIGSFFNIVPVRSGFPADARFSDLLRIVHDQADAAMVNAAYPFDLLLRDLKTHPLPGRSPVFDVMVTLRTLRDEDERENRAGSLVFEPYVMPSLSSKYDLLFDFVRRNENLKVLIEYNTGLFKEETVTEFCRILQVLLEAILVNPDIRIPEIGAPEGETPGAEDATESFFSF